MHTIIDASTGRPILMAPARQKRPILTAAEPHRGKAAPRCPFCPGHEADTPPAVGALDREGRDLLADDAAKPHRAGWVARAFPNLYPASEHHEVIAEGASHSQCPTQLTVAEWAVALQLAGQRLRAVEAVPGVACGFWFKNVGRMAGASIAHNHSQILGLPDLPPRLRSEWDHIGPDSDSPHFMAESLASAAPEGRLLGRAADGTSPTAGFAAFAPRHPKLPFETWVAPVDPGVDFCDLRGNALQALAANLHMVFTAFHRAFDGAPFNAWLHRVPQSAFHWHIELQPRTGFMAGLELGGDMYINAMPPADATVRLQCALDEGL